MPHSTVWRARTVQFLISGILVYEKDHSYHLHIGRTHLCGHCRQECFFLRCSYPQPRDRALLDAGDLDVLFLGSSTFRSNLDITQIDEAFDGKTFILAYGGNQYVAENIQYDEIQNRGHHRYDLLVIELNPMLLTEEVKLSDSRVIWDLSWDGKRRL